MRPLSSKVESIKIIGIPTKICDVHRFIGLVNYYRYMWCKHEHTLAPLTKLYLTKVKFKWTDIEKKSFLAKKKIVGRDVQLSYTKFIEGFIFYADASKMQLERVISQNGNTISFYSCKLTPAQINYTTT